MSSVTTAKDRKTDSGHRVGYMGFKDQAEYTQVLSSTVRAINDDPSLSPEEKRIAVRALTVKSAARLLNRFAKEVGLLGKHRTPLAKALDEFLSPKRKAKHQKSGLK